MEIEFNGKYEQAVYFKAIAWVFRPSRKALFLRIALFVLFAGLYITLTVSYIQGENRSSFELSRLLRHAVTLALLGYIVAQPYLSARSTANKLWKDPYVHFPVSGRVSSQGIMLNLTKEWLPWESFYKYQLTDEYLVMLDMKRTFLLLPRSFFAAEQDWNAVRELATTRIRPVIE